MEGRQGVGRDEFFSNVNGIKYMFDFDVAQAGIRKIKWLNN